MAIFDFIVQLATMAPSGAIIAVTFIVVTVLALAEGALIVERRFSGRTPAQRRDIIGLVRALRGLSEDR